MDEALCSALSLQLHFLFHIVDTHGPIRWKDLQLPPGRSVKACREMVYRMKKRAGTVDGNGGNNAKGRAKTAKSKSNDGPEKVEQGNKVSKTTSYRKRKMDTSVQVKNEASDESAFEAEQGETKDAFD